MNLRAIKPLNETQIRILDAAEELFMHHGFEGASMRMLTAKAGVNEVDVGKVRLEQPVKISLDAYPKVKFAGKIQRIAPAARLEDKVKVFDVEIDLRLLEQAEQRLDLQRGRPGSRGDRDHGRRDESGLVGRSPFRDRRRPVEPELRERRRRGLQPTKDGLLLFEEVTRSFRGLDRIAEVADAIRR